jgi:hypothetical protein
MNKQQRYDLDSERNLLASVRDRLTLLSRNLPDRPRTSLEEIAEELDVHVAALDRLTGQANA